MNAPILSIKAADGDTRDPFSGFVCDDECLQIVRQAAEEQGWHPEQVERGSIGKTISVLTEQESPQFLIVDLSDSGDPRSDINALAEVCEPGTVVIAIGTVNDVTLYRDLIASGVQDYLVKPLTAEVIHDALATAQHVLAHPVEEEKPSEDVKRVFCGVVGARGGVGSSFIATNLAWHAAHQVKRKTALFDLDIHFGTGALAFDLEPGRGLCDALENPGRIDGLFIERAMIKESATLSILGAEAPVTESITADMSALGQLEEELRKGFDVLIADIPRHLVSPENHLFSEMTDIILVTELSLAGTRDCIRMLAFFKEAAPDARIHFVANKINPKGGMEITRKDIEDSVERKLDFVIPLDTKNAILASKKGTVMAEAMPSSKASVQIKEVSAALFGNAEKKASFDIKGLFSGMKKKADGDKK